MSKLVALDWDDRQVRVILANQQGTDFTVENAVTVALNETDSENRSDELVKTIAKVVSEHRYKSAEAAITIRRADVELRLLSLPPVPADELPDIVRFQALKEFSEISEDWPVDYLPVNADTTEEMTVLAATVSKSRVNDFRSVATGADLKPHSLVLRPCAAASLVQHQSDLDDDLVQLMVDDFGTSIELTVLKGQTATFIRTVQNPPAAHRLDYLTGEVRRTIVAAQNQLGGEQVQQVILFGSGEEHQSFCKQLEERLQLSVQPIDPFAGLTLGRDLQDQLPESPERFAAALGLLVNQVDGRTAVLNFLDPRRVEEPKSNRPAMIGAVTVAATIALLIFGAGWWYLRSLDNAILDNQRLAQSQRPRVDAAQKKIDELAAVEKWLHGDINWLDELQSVSQDLPPANRTRVRELRAGVYASGNGYLNMEGVVDDEATISDIERNLRDDTHRVTGEGGLYEKQVKDLPWRFKTKIVVQTDPSNSQVDSGTQANRRGIITRNRRATP